MTRGPMSLEYIAGWFDGEGCIIIRGDSQYQVAVTVSHTDFAILTELQERFGGHIYQRRRYLPHHKPAWQWHMGEGNAAEFLKVLYPYLREKQQQAWLALEFLEQRTAVPTSLRGKGMSAHERALRSGYALAMSMAKRA